MRQCPFSRSSPPAAFYPSFPRKRESMKPSGNLKRGFPAFAGLTGEGERHGAVLLFSVVPVKNAGLDL
jgi:hypothetical protein